MSKAFKTLVIAVSGTHKDNTQSTIERYVKKNGGKFAKTIDNTTTHLISNDADVAKRSKKVKQALELSLHIVSLEWLTESIEKETRQPECEYAIEVPASQASEPRTSKRRAATVELETKDEVKDEEDAESKPPSKKTKVVDGTARSKRGAKKAVPETVKEEEDEEVKKPKSKTVTKGKGKAKAAVVKKEEINGEEKDEEEEEEEKVVMKTIIKKGKAPVDELCKLEGTHHVYVDSAGVAYDATLNQTNIGNNNNKFYYIQLLEQDDRRPNGYATFCHWGRVGEKGQCQFKVEDTTLLHAMSAFDKQMKAKTGQYWSDRKDAHGGGSKYTYLERNYEDDDDDDKINPLNGDAPEIADSQISKELQNLMRLIFNIDYMQQSMASLSYDSKKLPLGKLSKDTILRGYEVLKMIGEVISSPATAIPKYSEIGSNISMILYELSSRYYTMIPHDFGRVAPPAISTPQLLRKETELVENLVDMKISSEIIKDSTSKASSVNPIDSQYQSLGLDEAVALDKESDEFKHLKAYVKKTHGKTHHIKLTVEDIFRVTRSVEEDKWHEDGWDSLTNDNRKLLWHGSRTTNFGGILSQGLRIAPPEAPVNGYMFDKGIYLADVVSKSANYCCASSSGNTGLLLLCEAQLGDPMLELFSADYHASKKCEMGGHLATKGIGRTMPKSWEEAVVVNKNLKGVSMPKVSGKEANILTVLKSPEADLEYNEYIVYNTSQVKIRYLFRCIFK